MNPNMMNLNISAMHKHLCQSTIIVRTNDLFMLVIDLGDQQVAYAMTPEHMKQFSQSIQFNINEFEKNSRKIEANWSPGIQSPIQKDGLISSDKDGDSPKNKGK